MLLQNSKLPETDKRGSKNYKRNNKIRPVKSKTQRIIQTLLIVKSL